MGFLGRQRVLEGVKSFGIGVAEGPLSWDSGWVVLGFKGCLL